MYRQHINIEYLLEKRMARNLETHLVFINLKKPYVNLPLNTLKPALIENNVIKVCARAIKALYTDITSSIKIGNRVSFVLVTYF